jgi:hypothetical protein
MPPSYLDACCLYLVSRDFKVKCQQLRGSLLVNITPIQVRPFSQPLWSSRSRVPREIEGSVPMRKPRLFCRSLERSRVRKGRHA